MKFILVAIPIKVRLLWKSKDGQRRPNSSNSYKGKIVIKGKVLNNEKRKT